MRYWAEMRLYANPQSGNSRSDEIENELLLESALVLQVLQLAVQYGWD
jgi:hypothetical protein